MVKLTQEEQEILSGVQGRLKQVAMKNIVDYANVLNAKELCKITKATLFYGAHNYLNVIKSDDCDEVFSKMNLCLEDEIIHLDEIDEHCFAQTCVSICDKDDYKIFNQKEGVFEKNNRYLEMAKEAGIIFAGTCAPYLNGWIPMRGEHFVTTESGVTILGNSLWGACCNSDGIEAAYWSAICGRTPKWGNHCKENRYGTHLIKVEVQPQSTLEWDLLGKAVGEKMPFNCIPVIDGDFESLDFNHIRQFLTTLAIGSNCELCHILGHTPEAMTLDEAFGGKIPESRIVVTEKDLREAYEKYCEASEATIDCVSLGCPHYDIRQIGEVAKLLKGKKVKEGLLFMIWTSYPIKAMAEANGYLEIIENAGGKLVTGTCPGTIGPEFLGQFKNMALDSIKQCKSVKNMSACKTYYGDVKSCVEAACTGVWKEENRWKK